MLINAIYLKNMFIYINSLFASGSYSDLVRIIIILAALARYAGRFL